MTEAMPRGARRALTEGEWSAISPGLVEALRKANVTPQIVARASVPALVAAIRWGRAPIMVLGQRIFWSGAVADFSQPWSNHTLAVLQHELQHVLEFATGELSALRYVVAPRNWPYGYRLGADSQWTDFGAEQRASIAEHLWLIERRLMPDAAGGAHHRRVLPWA